MYPHDNIFNIYYNIGKRTPFLVKRCELGLERSSSEERRIDPNRDRTFLVETVKPKGKYGKAYGKCFVDGKPDDTYRRECYPNIKDDEIPCAGCGEWVLVDVPEVDMNEIFPVHKIDEILPFGMHKGKSIADIYKEDPKYIFWLLESDPYYKIDFTALTGIDFNDEQAPEKFNNEINRVFPKTTIEDTISFGKYKGLTYKDIYEKDPKYIDWFLRNNQTLRIDRDSFMSLFKDK